jgi:hypothetical protein
VNRIDWSREPSEVTTLLLLSFEDNGMWVAFFLLLCWSSFLFLTTCADQISDAAKATATKLVLSKLAHIGAVLSELPESVFTARLKPIVLNQQKYVEQLRQSVSPSEKEMDRINDVVRKRLIQQYGADVAASTVVSEATPSGVLNVVSKQIGEILTKTSTTATAVSAAVHVTEALDRIKDATPMVKTKKRKGNDVSLFLLFFLGRQAFADRVLL